jgi:hypothetical protein
VTGVDDLVKVDDLGRLVDRMHDAVNATKVKS